MVPTAKALCPPLHLKQEGDGEGEGSVFMQEDLLPQSLPQTPRPTGDHTAGPLLLGDLGE